MDPKDWSISVRISLIHNSLGSDLFNGGDYKHAEVEFSKVCVAVLWVHSFYLPFFFNFLFVSAHCFHFQAIQHNWRVSAYFVNRGNAFYYMQVSKP